MTRSQPQLAVAGPKTQPKLAMRLVPNACLPSESSCTALMGLCVLCPAQEDTLALLWSRHSLSMCSCSGQLHTGVLQAASHKHPSTDPAQVGGNMMLRQTGGMANGESVPVQEQICKPRL